MAITEEQFKNSINMGALKQVRLYSFFKVYSTVVRFYCNPLIARSACSQKCEQCILTVRNKLDHANWAGVQRPYGLLTVIVKDAFAAQVEQARDMQKDKPMLDVFHMPVDKDPLDLLLETLDG